ncbi:MAG: pseudouridylate synthase [Saprospiraceae bacterium]
MDNNLLFDFKTDLSGINIPRRLNNPFGGYVPEVSKIAVREFQAFIVSESQKWADDFFSNNGKMFGILVVQKKDHSYGYLGTVSGKLQEGASCNKFVPSIFDDSVGDFFIHRGMAELTSISHQIKNTDHSATIVSLKEKRRNKSIALQQRLFENYRFLNLSGKAKNLLDVFKSYSTRTPPSAAGECAAPKLLQYAIKQQLKPIALTEFWWGAPTPEKKHDVFYPACENRCRPILEYMLENKKLFIERKNIINEENI